MLEEWPSVAPITTKEEDLHSASQRKVNFTWELTQATVAISVTLAVIIAALMHISSPELTNAFFLIIGFYFSRTNHEKIGGVQINQAGR